MRAGPNSVLKMIPLVDNEGLVHTKPVVEMEVTLCSYRAPVQEIMDLYDHQYSLVGVSN
jgi:hypothetical protein